MNAPTDEREVTVLLVDDQERFRVVARTVIERTPGFRLVGEAVDGVDALAQMRTLRPSLVLMDIHMPELDGISATRRAAAESPDAVIVLLSSYARDDLPAGAMESGAAAYLHKEELGSATLTALWEQLRRSLGA